MSEEDNVSVANHQANAPCNARPVLREKEETTTTSDMDLSQVLDIFRNYFDSKIAEVYKAIQDVQKEVRDFLSRQLEKFNLPVNMPERWKETMLWLS